MTVGQTLANANRTRLSANWVPMAGAAGHALAGASVPAPGGAAAQTVAGAGTHAPAGVPSSSERTSLSRAGGPLDSIIPAGTDNFGAQAEVDR